MPTSSPRPAARRSDGLTPLALAAGLAFGHVVDAMARTGPGGPATALAALVFVIAGTTATACALAMLADGKGNAPARQRMAGWIAAVGCGLLAALAPTLM